MHYKHTAMTTGLLVFLLTSTLDAGGPATLWSKHQSSRSFAIGHSISLGNDGHFFMGADGRRLWEGTPRRTHYEAFLGKYDIAGNLIWGLEFGTTANDYVRQVAADSSGNCIVVGSTYGDLFGANQGSDDAFVVKYDGSGNQLWGKQFGLAKSDRAKAVTTDAVGNCYVTGYVWSGTGPTETFLLKLDADGNEVFYTEYGSSNSSKGYGIALDSSGNCYISGDETIGWPEQGEAFVAKFDVDGNELWSRLTGVDNATDAGTDVACDEHGNVYLTGGPQTAGSHVFVKKYDPDGLELWVEEFGAEADVDSTDIEISPLGDIFVCGGANGGALGWPFQGYTDAFLVGLDSDNGDIEWSWHAGTDRYDRAYGIATDSLGRIFMIGTTHGDLYSPNPDQNAEPFLVMLVPEPATLSLLVLGGLVVMRRRKN